MIKKIFPRLCFILIVMLIYSISTFAWVPPADDNASIPKKRWAIEAHQKELEDFEDASDIRWTTKDNKADTKKIIFTGSQKQEDVLPKQTPSSELVIIQQETQKGEVDDDVLQAQAVINTEKASQKISIFNMIKGFLSSVLH